MQTALHAWGEPLRYPVSVTVTCQKRCLKKEHTGRPNRGRTAEEGQNQATHQGLDREQEEGAQEDGGAVQHHQMAGPERWRRPGDPFFQQRALFSDHLAWIGLRRGVLYEI